MLRFCLLIFMCLSPVAGLYGQGVSAQDRPIAFVGVNVLPMDAERVLEGYTVVVEDERIAAVGPQASTAVPEGALRIDGTGRYLMPGLAEMHGHIPPPTADPVYVENVLFLYVANGITTVRGMLGHEGQLDLRARANRGDLLAPTLYLAGPGFSGQSVDSPEHAAAMVRRQKAEGWDLLKIFPGLSREEYDAVARTAHTVGIRFAGHVPADVGVLHALEMKQETIDHIDGYIEHLGGQAGPVDEAALADLVYRTQEAGTWIVPTMVLWETLQGTAELEALLAFEELRYMPPDVVAAWRRSFEQRGGSDRFDPVAARHVIDNRMRLLRAMHEGGVRILMGTDAPQQFSVPGFSLHREVVRMAEAGMSPYEILVTGTRNVGEYFRDRDAFGLVVPGMRADLVLLEANPLEDVGHLRRRAGVMVRGRWLPESVIQERLAQIAAAYAGDE